jgi:outer membrane receptor protein involved in Fe transport
MITIYKQCLYSRTRTLLFTLIMVLSVSSIYSQPKADLKTQIFGSISGKIIDKNTSLPIEYANIVLYKMPDSVIVGGSVSLDNGIFKIDKVAFGKYAIRIQFIGYNPTVKNGLVVSSNKEKCWVGSCEMQLKTDNIEEVTVTAKKNIVETHLDKKVINVDQAILSTGGTAVDVLKNVPSVSVDAEGNLSLRGSDNVTVLIDGRPSSYTSLDQVPASIIDRVEIVTNPSAKFDASGMVGIVNIITKHKTGQGLNGQISGNYGTWNKYNGNATINYGTEKANFYVICDGRQNNSVAYNSQFIESGSKYSNTYKETDTSQRTMRMGSVKFGFDYSFNDKNQVSIALFDRQFYAKGNQTAMNYYTSNSILTNDFMTKTRSDMRNAAFVPTMQYKRLFNKKDESLIFTVDGDIDYPANTTTYYDKNDTIQKGISKAYPMHYYTLAADYSVPIKEKSKFECGLKFNDVYSEYSNSQTKQYNGISLPDTFLQSGNVTHREMDGYSQFGSQYKNLQYQFGLRMQSYTVGSKDYQNNTSTNKTYINPFPSFAILYKKNEDNIFQLNYSKRVNYPDSRIFNPSLIKSDATNWTKGNALILPEFVNSFELGYSMNRKKLSMTNTVFYRLITNTLTKTQSYGVYPLLSGDPILISSMINGKQYQAYGFEHFDNFTLTKWLKHSLNFTVNVAELNDSILKTHNKTPNISWLMKYSLTINPIKSVELVASVNYNSKTVSMQGGSGRFNSGPSAGLLGENWQSDLSLRKTFWKGKASLSARLSDVFKTSRYYIDYYTANSHSTILKTRDSRVLYVGFMYKINGGLKQKKKSNENQDSDF